MLKTYLYVPSQLEEKIVRVARDQHKSKAEVMRQALEEGIGVVSRQGSASAEALLRLAEVGKMHNPKGPKDLSSKLDGYLWGRDDGRA
jgi:predicted transcriptional regulator